MHSSKLRKRGERVKELTLTFLEHVTIRCSLRRRAQIVDSVEFWFRLGESWGTAFAGLGVIVAAAIASITAFFRRKLDKNQSSKQRKHEAYASARASIDGKFYTKRIQAFEGTFNLLSPMSLGLNGDNNSVNTLFLRRYKKQLASSKLYFNAYELEVHRSLYNLLVYASESDDNWGHVQDAISLVERVIVVGMHMTQSQASRVHQYYRYSAKAKVSFAEKVQKGVVRTSAKTEEKIDDRLVTFWLLRQHFADYDAFVIKQMESEEKAYE